jgi:membrane associated rhomboid family serine protease
MQSDHITLLLLIVLGFTTHQGLTRYGVMAKYRFSSEAIRLRRQWVRLVSPAFLHANWGHFASNAITLFFFGRGLERAFGPDMLLGVFFLSVIGGSGLCLLLHRREEYQALGASGGALGVLFACVFLMPGMSIMLFPLPIPIPAWFYAMGFLLYTLKGVHSPSGGISHEGHLGGLISGVLVAWMSRPALVQSQPILLVMVLGLSAAGVWYFHANPGRVPGFLRWHVKEKVNAYKRRRSQDQALHVDALLDKVAEQGLHSLTDRERKALEEASKQRRAGR